jgi:hypothetical protein
MKVLTFESLLCRAIRTRVVLTFDYDGLARVVHPYCHGTTPKGQQLLRAVQVDGHTRSGGMGYGKLWTVSKLENVQVTTTPFIPDDPNYNPDDTAFATIHCRIER